MPEKDTYRRFEIHSRYQHKHDNDMFRIKLNIIFGIVEHKTQRIFLPHVDKYDIESKGVHLICRVRFVSTSRTLMLSTHFVLSSRLRFALRWNLKA